MVLAGAAAAVAEDFRELGEEVELFGVDDLGVDGLLWNPIAAFTIPVTIFFFLRCEKLELCFLFLCNCCLYCFVSDLV